MLHGGADAADDGDDDAEGADAADDGCEGAIWGTVAIAMIMKGVSIQIMMRAMGRVAIIMMIR